MGTFGTLKRSSRPHDARCPTCNRVGPDGESCQHCGASLAATHRVPAGTLLGQYRVEDVLGEGSMGIVYLAKHIKLDRRVAIKMLKGEYADNKQAIQRFFAEARAVNKISHPNVIQVTDFFEQPGTDNYYVMELLEGASLAVLIDTGGPVAIERTVTIMSQLADAMVAVHQARIVHRDIKPDNVVLVEKAGIADFVKLCDFGVAKLIEPGLDEILIHRTHAGAILGTPEYMSPEQASGRSVDEKSDVYSFGVLMYELLTGRLPFRAPDFGELVVQLLTISPVPPSKVENLPHTIPPSVEQLVLACLAKKPADRPSMEDVAKRLDDIAVELDMVVYELSAKASTRMPAIRAPSHGDVTPVPGPLPTPPPTPTPGPPPPAERPPPPPQQSAAPRIAPARRRLMPAVIVASALALGGTIAIVFAKRSPTATSSSADRAKIDAALALADARIAEGRFVAAGGDGALDHLVAARKIDPKHAGVQQRLHELARTFEQLADQALAAGSLAEAAAHLEAVRIAEPDNAAVAHKIEVIERKMLERQRGK